MRLAIALVLLGTSIIHAAPPTVTGLFPAGGQSGTTVEVTASGSYDVWPVQVWCSSPLISFTCGKEKGKFTLKLDRNVLPGTYWLRFHTAEGASSLRPFIVSSLPEVVETEPNDTPSKVQPVTLPVIVNGKLNRNGDLDAFVLWLKAGQTLVASVESHHTLRSAADMVMQLTDSAGTVIQQNHDYHGLDPQISFTAPRDGKYQVRVFAFPANPDSSIRYAGGDLYVYRLTLTTGPFLDHVLPLAIANDEMLPRLQGWNLGSQTRIGTMLPGTERQTIYHPAATGLAMIQQERWPAFDDTLGDRQSHVFTAPCSITAPLTTSHPVYRTQMKLTKGKKFYLEALSQTLGLDTDPVLTLHDSTGKEVLRAEAATLHADVTTNFTPPTDGIYTLTVRDLHGRSGWRQAVLLRAYPAEPRFTMHVDTDRYLLTVGKPLSIPVKITALDGFLGPPELQVEGLPRDVSWKVIPTSKAAANTVTVRLETISALNASFSIVSASTKGQPKVLALTSGTDIGPRSQLWLTCTIPPLSGKK